MNIFNGFSDINLPPCSAVTIGTYDGIHKGHKLVLSQLVQKARKNKCQSVVITFYPHPRHVLYPEQSDLKLIDTEEEKLAKFKKIGIDNLVIIPFTKEFAATSYITFVEEYLVKKLRIRSFVLGKDHRFGKQREGDAEAMQKLAVEYGFTFDYVETLFYEDQEISSTKIRKALAAGDIETSTEMIGDYFTLAAEVVPGKKIGHTIGFPTANLEVNNKNKIIPAQGVYAVLVKYENAFLKGMLNIGTNPTVSNDATVKIEVNIFDFNADIYGKTLEISFVKRIRDELSFSSLEQLSACLEQDKEEALKILTLL
jgi:riboflavin kinase / FMN adenylyltransferase